MLSHLLRAVSEYWTFIWQSKLSFENWCEYLFKTSHCAPELKNSNVLLIRKTGGVEDFKETDNWPE